MAYKHYHFTTKEKSFTIYNYKITLTGVEISSPARPLLATTDTLLHHENSQVQIRGCRRYACQIHPQFEHLCWENLSW
jgi:hypothetical protein